MGGGAGRPEVIHALLAHMEDGGSQGKDILDLRGRLQELLELDQGKDLRARDMGRLRSLRDRHPPDLDIHSR
eukprot:15057289-Alexandrium_andersonii.AAC.1